MKKTLVSLIFILALVGTAQAQRSLTRPDLSIKTLNFNPVKISPSVNGVELAPMLQKNPGDKISIAQTISIRMVDSYGKPVAMCELIVPAWTSTETTTTKFPTCSIGSETYDRVSRFYVTADAGKQVSESNESNNEFVSARPSILMGGAISVAYIPGAKKSDLVIQAMKFTPDFNKLIITPQNICPGAANIFFVTVVFHESSEESSKAVYSIGQKVLFLNGGFQTTEVTLDVSAFTQGKDVRGTNFITLTVDPTDYDKESAEDNNYLKMGADKKGIYPPPKPSGYCQTF